MYFLHEHPYSASSWKEPCVEEIMATKGVKVVRGDMCAFGMWQESNGSTEGKELVMKPTGFMTNAQCIAEELGEKCNRSHRHVASSAEDQAWLNMTRCVFQNTSFHWELCYCQFQDVTLSF